MRTADGQIIERCLAGETEAFGVLVDKYRSSMYALAYSKIRDFQEAEDITQEAFLIAYQKLRSLRRWDSFFAWMYAITANLCKKWLKKRAERLDSEPLVDQEIDKRSLAAHDDKLVHQSVHEALADLPEIYRQVLSLYYLGGMNTREIAEFLGTSVKTIESRLSRARAKLKEEMITTMTTTFDEVRLQPGFTFRVVEAIKQTKIQAPPSKMTLPLSVSATMGLIVLLLSLSLPYSPLYPIGQLIGSALPSQTQVLEEGEIAVDAIQVDRIISLSPEMDKGDLGKKPLPEPAEMFGGGKWERKADMPGRRGAMAIATAEDKIYVFGGFENGPVFPATFVATVEAYHPNTDTWERKTDMPTRRTAPSASLVDGRVYVMGGYEQRPLATVEEYDPVADMWRKRTDMPTPRTNLLTAVVGGKIYAIGGLNHLHKDSAAVEMYDPVTDTWTKKRDMPTPRWGLSGGVVEGKIYAIGGAINGWLDDGLDKAISTVEIYDPVADVWSKGTDIPTPRFNFSASIVNGKIFAIGGSINLRDPVLPSVETYDPLTDTWTKQTDMPTPRDLVATTVYDGKVFAIGGQGTAGRIAMSAVEVLTPDLPQSVNPAGKLPTTWGEVKAAR